MLANWHSSSESTQAAGHREALKHRTVWRGAVGMIFLGWTNQATPVLPIEHLDPSPAEHLVWSPLLVLKPQFRLQLGNWAWYPVQVSRNAKSKTTIWAGLLRQDQFVLAPLPLFERAFSNELHACFNSRGPFFF